MPANHGRMSFNVRPPCTSLISTLLSLDLFRQIVTLPFTLGTSTKLLLHSYVSSMPRGTIICCLCNLFSSSFRGHVVHMLSFWGHLIQSAPILYLQTKCTFKAAYAQRKHHRIHYVSYLSIPCLTFYLLLCWCWN